MLRFITLIAQILYSTKLQIGLCIFLAAAITASGEAPFKQQVPIYFEIQEGIVDEACKKLTSKEILFATSMWCDGLGDYFNIMVVASKLHEEYPGQKIRLILGMKTRHNEDLVAKFLSLQHVLHPPSWCSFEVVMNKDAFPEASIARINHAAYYIDTHPEEDSILSLIREPDIRYIELGDPHIPQKGVACRYFGLYSDEDGLLLPNIEHIEAQVSNIQSPWLQEKLQYAQDSENIISVAYFNYYRYDEASTPDLIGFIKKNLEVIPKEKNLTVFSNKFLEKPQDAERLLALLARELSIHVNQLSIENEKGELLSFNFSEGPQRVEILIPPTHLIHDDMLILKAHSNAPFIGSTGDQSWSEDIVMNKAIPYYQVRKHKKRLFESYVSTAEEQLGIDHPLVIFLKTKTIENYPLALEGAQQLHDWIKQKKDGAKCVIEILEDSFQISKPSDTNDVKHR